MQVEFPLAANRPSAGLSDGSQTYDSTSNVIRHMSGTWGNNVQSTIISTGSDMYMNIISDAHGSARNGFRIQYSSYGK